MNVLVRCDASEAIGTGHAVRCLTLADALRARGASVAFACREHLGHPAGRIRDRGFDATLLPARSPIRLDPRPPYGAWLGVEETEDAAETLRAGADGADLVVVDHYGIGEVWHRAVRGRCRALLAVDDLADRRYDCDVLLDQNLWPDPTGRYAGRVSDRCRLLLGPAFALLRPQFEAARETEAGAAPEERVLVFFGADPEDMTSRAVRAALSLPRPGLTVTAVLADAARRVDAAPEPRLTVRAGVEDMAGLMAGSAVAVGAPGTSTWERLCIGLPSVLVSVAANQEPIGRAVDAAGAAVYLGRSAEVGDAALAGALSALLSDAARRAAMRRRAMALVDGRGAARVAEAVFETVGR